MVLCDRAYPKKLAYAYLDELQREFMSTYRDLVGTVARPYSFMDFGGAGGLRSPAHSALRPLHA